MRSQSLVFIRRATREDLPAITDIYNEAVLTTAATFDIRPKTMEQQLEWFQAHGPRHPILVAVRGADVVGWCSLNPWSMRCAYADTGEISFYVKSEFRGQGIGGTLLGAIIDEAHRLRFHTLVARVATDSAASLHLFDKAGFVRAGTLREVGRKFGRLLHIHILQKMLE